MTGTPDNPYAGMPVQDLQAERNQFKRTLAELDRSPSRTDAWQKAVQHTRKQLSLIRDEIGRAPAAAMGDGELSKERADLKEQLAEELLTPEERAELDQRYRAVLAELGRREESAEIARRYQS